ncbi:helix-turn-helix domain-containing protein [Serratia bockelmannii]|uniref:helix-turn-helix domain-containing protein n=1 Tax=Serratia bockelmannii TaxID=2703793 RepID=UPI0023605686|nr:helix-turn-helix transcriptional regulator [Serratia bockelmannii]
MTRSVKILIVEPDRFFVAGLQYVVKAYFQARGIQVLFMWNPLSYPLADLIFWAPGYPATEIPPGLLTGRKRSRVILLMSQQRPHLAAYCVSSVFYHHQDCSKLASLIEMTIDTTAGAPIHTVTDAYAALLDGLSPRQREVLCYVSQGLRLNDIAARLHIHEKTVSNHKRTAMRRLQLERTTDLHHWLLCNSILEPPF